MTLTAEEKQATHAPYDVPHRRIGQLVKWYPNGRENAPYRFAYVHKLGDRFTELQLTSGEVIRGVCHVGDPKLKNPNIRDNGSWDFTESDHAADAVHADLEKRIAALESALLGDSGSEREFLMLLARKAGMNGYSKMKNEEIRKALIEQRDAVPAESA